MIIKLGDRSQLYGNNADPAVASKARRTVISALKQEGIVTKAVNTGVMGPDVWLEIEDNETPKLLEVVETLSEVGGVSVQTDEKYGKYVDLPLIIETRQLRSRR